MSNNHLTYHQLTNSLINQLSHNHKHSVSRIENPSSVLSHPSSVLVPLQLSRELYKSTLFMQNKANSPSVQDDITSFPTRTYKNYVLKSTPKNKAKQSQNKPNFGLKLASFFSKLALFFPNRICKNGRSNRNVTENCLCGLGIFVIFQQNLHLQYDGCKNSYKLNEMVIKR